MYTTYYSGYSLITELTTVILTKYSVYLCIRWIITEDLHLL